MAHYQIVDRLGAGGLGEVFRGRDTRHGRSVAIKRVTDPRFADRESRERLVAAARRLQGLSHPSIAELYEIVEDGESLSLIFEYVDGEPLTRTIGGRPLNPRRAAELAAQIADGLAEGHAAGVLHLDLRPDTIMVSRKGRAKILDFGLSGFSRTGELRRRAVQVAAPDAAASLGYMSPEQALGEAEDARSDIFSLGVIFYEMLTGEAPFTRHEPGATVMSVLHATVTPPGERNPAVPREFDAVVARMLARSLDGRYQSAAAAAADLRTLSERTEPAFAPAPTRVSEPARRSWLMPAVLGLAAAAGVAWWIWGG
ncbi:MAG TPA: serine/threonine-protein kinase [Vicinamibacterales bacterium]|nr:serine/threonine-protein kinase [Vicinamibacterales bacterium]